LAILLIDEVVVTMDPWDHGFNDEFLDFDDDNFTAEALARIPQHDGLPVDVNVPMSAHVQEMPSMRECKLFLGVSSVERIPFNIGCAANCSKTYLCDIEIVKTTASISLTAHHENMPAQSFQPSFRPLASAGQQTTVWSLAEYFGDTKITIKLKECKLLRDVVVGTRTMKLSELFFKQRDHTTCELVPGAWTIKHEVIMHTSLKDHSVKPQRRRVNNSSANSWLVTAKHARSSLSGAPSVGPTSIEKQKMRILNPEDLLAGNSSPGSAYEALPVSPAQTAPQKPKGVEVTVCLEFRLVQLQHCVQLGLTAALGSGVGGVASVSPGPGDGINRTPVDRRAVSPGIFSPGLSLVLPSEATQDHASPASPGSNAHTATGAKEYVHISELHYLTACAPAATVVEVMRALSRKDALTYALELRHTPAADPAARVPSASTTGRARPRRSLLSANLTNSGTDGATTVTGWTPFEFALLYRQEQTVLDMLQRCGSLCFPHLTAGRGSPLHAAVRGGCIVCVEYLVKYLRKYGTRRVTGPGARLWASSLSAKLEWRNAQDDTALALVCRLPATASTHSIAMYLLIQGADPAAVNAHTGYTPLMYACEQGPTQLVATLLSIVKTPQDVLDGILNVGDVNSILNNTALLDVEPAVRMEIQTAIATAAHVARNSALAYHLQTNARSNNILRGRSTTEGGHFNPLSVYICEPGRRELTLKRTALHLAVLHGRAEMVEQLLDIGMSCADADCRGDNSLHLAARRGERALTAKLVEAELREWGTYKETVRQGKSLEAMQHRSQALWARNCVGETPIDIALEGRHFAALDELLRGAMRAYGTIPVVQARQCYRQLEELQATVAPHSPAAAPTATSQAVPTTPGTLCSGCVGYHIMWSLMRVVGTD
jgi:hypothetical protein